MSRSALDRAFQMTRETRWDLRRVPSSSGRSDGSHDYLPIAEITPLPSLRIW